MALIEWPFFFNARNYPTHPPPSLDSLILSRPNPQHNTTQFSYTTRHTTFTPLLSLCSWTLEICNMKVGTIPVFFLKSLSHTKLSIHYYYLGSCQGIWMKLENWFFNHDINIIITSHLILDTTISPIFRRQSKIKSISPLNYFN